MLKSLFIEMNINVLWKHISNQSHIGANFFWPYIINFSNLKIEKAIGGIYSTDKEIFYLVCNPNYPSIIFFLKKRRLIPFKLFKIHVKYDKMPILINFQKLQHNEPLDQFKEIEDTGHFLELENPTAVCEAIQTFLLTRDSIKKNYKGFFQITPYASRTWG